MSIRILTVPFDPAAETFQDEVVNAFLLNKKVKNLQYAFFQHEKRAFWTILVEYDTTLPRPREDETRDLAEPQRLFYDRLREWRKETAERQGVPVYLIATNAQLKELVRHAPDTLEALRKIHGFGKRKAETLGAQIIEMVKAFQRHQPAAQPAAAPPEAPQGAEPPPWEETPES